jgi:energy-coupling factor transport system ATP-binding protein
MSARVDHVASFESVSVTYPDAAHPALSGLDATFEEGELALVVGPTGSGKSTMLRATCGLVPHFSGGTLHGRVQVMGRSTEDHPPRALADVVGYVGQNPSATFVTDSVEEELAYGMENLGFDPAVMRRRVEEVMDLLGLADLRDRGLSTLSGGQQQRVAIAAVLAAGPDLLVLDEPTSSLDPASAEDVLAALARLVHDVGLTVLLAEHRLERIIHLSDRMVVLDRDGAPRVDEPRLALADSPVAPPLVQLARLAGWEPIPLSIREARRFAVDLRERLEPLPRPSPAGRAAGEVAANVKGLTRRFGTVTALDEVDLTLHAGQVTVLMGRNGSGKTTLLRHLAGVVDAKRGSVLVAGADPASISGMRRVREIGFLPQDPSLLLYGQTVAEECRLADDEGALAAGTTAATLRSLGADLDADRHPRDLSEGQRLTLALAVVLAHRPRVVLADEPTRGLDYDTKHRLRDTLVALAEQGHAVVVATHDVEFAAAVADRAVVLAEGAVIADGPAREVVCQSQVFAPQVAKIVAPAPWLTVDEIAAAVGRVR